jgi:beta-galactosidase
MVWNNTVYAPGEVVAVAYENGKEVAREYVRTAGVPHHVELSGYYDSIAADGESLNFITARILDKDGNLCPKADNRLTFTAVGGAVVYATDAGDQRECETFLRSDKKALHGMLVCCVKSSGKAEKAVVSCSSLGLGSASVVFRCT